MSMKSDKACKKVCPHTQKACRGNGCPNWIVERMANGAISCPMSMRIDGMWNTTGIQANLKEIDECLREHAVDMCIDCGNAYGHCSG